MWTIISSILFSQWTAILLILCGILYKLGTAKYKFFEKKNIPFEKPFPWVGNLGGIFRKHENFPSLIEKLYLKFRDRTCFGFFQLRTPLLVINNLDIIKRIAIKDFDHFVDHHQFLAVDVDPILSRALTMLRGQEWRDMRSTLSPAFTGSKMRQIFQFVGDCTQEAVELLRTETKNETIVLDMKELCSRVTTDVIATAAFGYKVNSLKDRDNEFFAMGQKTMNQNQNFIAGVKFMFMTAFPRVARLLGLTLFPSENNTFFRKIVAETIEYRQKHGTVRPDMIHLLMEARKGHLKESSADDDKVIDDGFAAVDVSPVNLASSGKRSWSEDDIVAQSLVFFFAGFDTTANLICFTAQELAENPNIQMKLFQEITSVTEQLQDKPITYDVLQKMKYLDLVVTECLRKWPPAIATDRSCAKTYVIEKEDGQKVTINPGDVVMFPIYGLQHDPEYFPEPKKFDPERFSDENKDSFPPGAYMPFGMGPRNCIGSRFALMEVKAVIFYLLKAFSFEISAKTQAPIKLENSFVLKPEKGFFLGLKPRA